MATELESALGISVNVSESGVHAASPSPGRTHCLESRQMLRHHPHPAAGQEVDIDRLDALIRRKPAHSPSVAVRPGLSVRDAC